MPTWFRATVLGLLVVILIGVIVLDFRSKDFEAQATALALIGAIGAGVAEIKSGGGDE